MERPGEPGSPFIPLGKCMTNIELAGYDLVEPVGKGAGSVIWKATDLEADETVAVKIVVPTTKDEERRFRHIEKEFETLQALWVSAGSRNGSAPITRPRRLLRSRKLLTRQKFRAMVMDFLPGADLRREIRYPLGQMLDFFVQVTETLGFLHGLGVVHADVKPENLMVSPSGHVTLIDFGLCCPLGTRATSIRGTRDYMAPEQLDQSLIDERTDLYNLGACFYFLLTGQRLAGLQPVNGGQDSRPSRRAGARPIDELNPHVPAAVARVITDCLRTRPERRPSSTVAVLRALRPAVMAFGGLCQGGL